MKNVLKLLCLLVVLQLGVGSARAARLSATVYGYKITYQSVDANNEPITLSEMVYLNYLDYDLKFILFTCHPTTTSNSLAPTGSDPQVAALKYMCDGTEKCMVVAPDYLGYGKTVGETHPYMCSTLTARNSVDGLLAAIKYAKSKGYSFASDYYTINTGYSQGGAAALAVHRYIETEMTSADQKTINLKGSICGAGPYKQTYMFDAMEPQTDIFYPLYIPYTIDGLRKTFGKSTLRDLQENEIYTETFLNSGLLETMRAKNTKAADLNTAFANKFGGKIGFYDMVRDEYKKRDSKLYRGLRKALTQCDLLDGWKPTKPIIFYHWSEDDVVPYQETLDAYNYFDAKNCNVKLIEPGSYSGTLISGTWAGANILSDLGVSSLDLTQTHMGYGTRYYLSILSGEIRTLLKNM